MITLSGAIGSIVGLGFAYAFLLSGIVPLTAFLWFCAVLLAAVTALVYAWLIKSGEKKFVEL